MFVYAIPVIFILIMPKNSKDTDNFIVYHIDSMNSKAFHEFFIEKHVCDGRFIAMAKAMGLKDADKPEDFSAALDDLQLGNPC